MKKLKNEKGCNFCNGSTCILNIHIDKNPYTLEIIKDKNSVGLALLEHEFLCLGVFDVKFCPVCGKNFDYDFDYKERKID